MARWSNSPTILDDCKTISISKLLQWGYLTPNRITKAVIRWTYGNGEPSGSVGILAYLVGDERYIELDYTTEGVAVRYRIPLETLPSNLGKGVVWFFRCPKTGKRCKKLHLAGRYFYHRTAFSDCFYEKQTKSHRERAFHQYFASIFVVEESLKKMAAKYFKRYYNGIATKRYKRLFDKIEEAQSRTLDSPIGKGF